MNQGIFIIFTTICVCIYGKNERDFDNWDKKGTDKCSKFGKLSCNTSLANWLESIKDPNLLSYQKYNENDQPLDSENLEILIDFTYIQQAYGGVEMKEYVIVTQKGDIVLQ